jgi:hypothetical protein
MGFEDDVSGRIGNKRPALRGRGKQRGSGIN